MFIDTDAPGIIRRLGPKERDVFADPVGRVVTTIRGILLLFHDIARSQDDVARSLRGTAAQPKEVQMTRSIVVLAIVTIATPAFAQDIDLCAVQKHVEDEPALQELGPRGCACDEEVVWFQSGVVSYDGLLDLYGEANATLASMSAWSSCIAGLPTATYECTSEVQLNGNHPTHPSLWTYSCYACPREGKVVSGSDQTYNDSTDDTRR